MFTKETALLFLLDALRDSLSRSQACCLVQEELSSSSSGSLAACPRALAMIHPPHEARPAAGTRHTAAPRDNGRPWLKPAVPCKTTCWTMSQANTLTERSPHGHTQRWGLWTLQPMYIIKHVFSKHTDVLLTNSPLCCWGQSSGQPPAFSAMSFPITLTLSSQGAPTLDTEGQLLILGLTAGQEVAWRTLAFLVGVQARQLPLFSCPREQMTNLLGLASSILHLMELERRWWLVIFHWCSMYPEP